MAFEHILLALDRTRQADLVLEQGISLTIEYQADLTLAHCVSEASILAAASAVAPVGVGIPWTGSTLSSVGTPLMADPSQEYMFSENLDHQVEAAQNWLRQYVKQAYDAGCETVVPVVRMGKPGSSLCDLADELESDLIIVGRKDRTGLEELVLGSVSNYVVHHAPCTVLVVPTERY